MDTWILYTSKRKQPMSLHRAYILRPPLRQQLLNECPLFRAQGKISYKDFIGDLKFFYSTDIPVTDSTYMKRRETARKIHENYPFK